MKRTRKSYYIPFNPEAKVNYLWLFSLYDIAKYTPATKAFDTICYPSAKRIAEEAGLTKYAVDTMIKKTAYSHFLSVQKTSSGITLTLKNSFTKGTKTPFVKLTAEEVALLRTVKESQNLFCQYLIYLKYYCGYSKTKKTDFTAKQFLSAFGYSTKSNNYISKISSYNTLLQNNGFIRIEPYTDDLGHTRNVYSLICQD